MTAKPKTPKLSSIRNPSSFINDPAIIYFDESGKEIAYILYPSPTRCFHQTLFYETLEANHGHIDFHGCIVEARAKIKDRWEQRLKIEKSKQDKIKELRMLAPSSSKNTLLLSVDNTHEVSRETKTTFFDLSGKDFAYIIKSEKGYLQIFIANLEPISIRTCKDLASARAIVKNEWKKRLKIEQLKQKRIDSLNDLIKKPISKTPKIER